MIRKVAICGLAIAALGACAEVEREPDIRAPEARVTGEPVSCLSLSRIRNQIVHDDYTIDFETTGGQLYRNTLPNRCPRLGFEKAISFSTSINRLCRNDIISVLDTSGGGLSRGASCGLGDFVPIELVEENDE